MSKRYKGKDAHYRLQIKKDGEWQDLGIVASAEMDNKNVDDTTTTNFDEKYIHRSNTYNDSDSTDDVKTTQLQFTGTEGGIIFSGEQACAKGIKFENRDGWDASYCFLSHADTSSLIFKIEDNANDNFKFQWNNAGKTEERYTFNNTSLDAPNVTAKFATIQSNTYYNSDGTKMLDFYPTDKKWETNIYNGKAGQDSTLSIWGSTENDTAEASIQYRNKTDGESWTVGVNTDGRKDNSFAWYSHKSQAGNRMWLTHDGTLNVSKSLSFNCGGSINWTLADGNDLAKIYTEGSNNDLKLILQTGDDGNEPIIFRSYMAYNKSHTEVCVDGGSLIADHDLTAKGNIKLADDENIKFTMSYNNTDQCVDFLF